MMTPRPPHPRPLTALVACLLTLTACTLSTPPADPTAPPTLAAQSPTQAAPLPSVTPLPSPTHTPAPPASDVLPQARKAAHDGYYEEALRLFGLVLYDPAAQPADLIDAAVGSAEVALREGGFEPTVTTLTPVIDRLGAQAAAAPLYFLRGEANLGLGRWTSAINDYRQYLALRPNLIDSYVHERVGDAFLALGMTEDALTAYGQATNAERARVPRVALRERVAQVYVSLGRGAQALAEYDAIIAASQSRAYQADISLRAAEAARAAGDASAPLRYKTTFETYIDVPAAALPAMAALSDLGVAVSNYDRGRAYFYAEDFVAAIDAFNAHTTSVVLMEIPVELYLLLGRAYREAGNAPAALVAFRTIVEQHPTHPLFGEALLEQGRTTYQNGEPLPAARTYISIADTYPNLPDIAAEALWRAGFIYNEQGGTSDALATFERLVTTYPTSAQAATGASIAANAALAAQDFGQAEQWFTRAANAATGEPQAEAYRQIGLLATRRGAQDMAQAAYQSAIAAAPDSYTAARVREQLLGLRPFQPPATFTLTPDETAAQAEAETWVRDRFTVEGDAPLASLPERVQTHPAWLRAVELWRLGQFNAAEVEMVEALGAFDGDGAALYAMALALRDLGAYYPSQQAAANLIGAAGSSTAFAPAFIARLRFPAPYPDLMARISGEYQVDPLLLLSLMRTESLFDTYAVAAAGEKGMTQVIPATGAYIAEKIGWPDYQHEDLFRPHASITFGAAYLSEQLGLFERNVPVALSAYNAGPGRGIAWRDASDGATDFDRFLAAISITSTRGYVQRIYTFYVTYRALYAG
jgi:soluble lytic murein transglycosylase